MTQTQQKLEKLYTLQECLDRLTSKYDELATGGSGGAAQAKAYYDSNTGNLTFENIELTIE